MKLPMIYFVISRYLKIIGYRKYISLLIFNKNFKVSWLQFFSTSPYNISFQFHLLTFDYHSGTPAGPTRGVWPPQGRPQASPFSRSPTSSPPRWIHYWTRSYRHSQTGQQLTATGRICCSWAPALSKIVVESPCPWRTDKKKIKFSSF